MRNLLRVFALAWGILLPGLSLAHPHIWVDTKLDVVFDGAGRISELRQEWLFDQAFTAWAIQGLDTNADGQVDRAELHELTEEYISGLSAYDFYTFAGRKQDRRGLTPGPERHMELRGDRLVFVFSLFLDRPVPKPQNFAIEVADPEYYVDFKFPQSGGAALINAPAGCTIEAHPPKELDPETAARLAEIGPEQRELPPELKAAVDKITNLAVVQCADGAAIGGADAAVAQKRSAAAPFAAPPAERAIPLPQTGFLGEINRLQKQFYAQLTAALGAIKSDGRAFWLLGGLSFVYGIFHAAGPGHGKFVISSYVLAERAKLWQGIGLSLASALMQSLTAIVFVLAGAAVFDMTAVALSGSFLVLEQVSYLALAAIGGWLLWRTLRRRFFGPDRHAHAHAGAHGDDAQATDAACGHEHFVSPSRLPTNWREAASIVLAVGLRPCSGALIVLVFAISQGLILAGVGAVLLMGLGTAITVAALASFAVLARGAALGLARRGDDGMARTLGGAIEYAGGLGVIALGLVLFAATLV